jgi:hypothetical protein
MFQQDVLSVRPAVCAKALADFGGREKSGHHGVSLGQRFRETDALACCSTVPATPPTTRTLKGLAVVVPNRPCETAPVTAPVLHQLFDQTHRSPEWELIGRHSLALCDFAQRLFAYLGEVRVAMTVARVHFCSNARDEICSRLARQLR